MGTLPVLRLHIQGSGPFTPSVPGASPCPVRSSTPAFLISNRLLYRKAPPPAFRHRTVKIWLPTNRPYRTSSLCFFIAESLPLIPHWVSSTQACSPKLISLFSIWERSLMYLGFLIEMSSLKGSRHYVNPKGERICLLKGLLWLPLTEMMTHLESHLTAYCIF